MLEQTLNGHLALCHLMEVALHRPSLLVLRYGPQVLPVAVGVEDERITIVAPAEFIPGQTDAVIIGPDGYDLLSIPLDLGNHVRGDVVVIHVVISLSGVTSAAA